MVSRFGGAILILMFIASCSSWTKPNNSPSHFPERVFSKPWSMNSVDLERLRLNVNALNLGDDIRQVIDTVGIPDRDYTVKKNDNNRFLTYHVTRQRTDSRIESDKVVVIALNDRDKVKAIYSNVETIPSRNWPK